MARLRRSLYHVAGINTFCPTDPARAVPRQRRAAPRSPCAPPRAPACARVVLTSSAAALGEAQGTVGREDSPHRGSYLSLYERSKHEGELAAVAAAAQRRARARRGQPVLGPGPGPRRRHRPDPDRLPQRPPEGVRRHALSLVDIARLRRGPPAGGRARPPGERYVLNGATLTSPRGAGARHRAHRVAARRRGSCPPSVAPRRRRRWSRAASASRGAEAAGVPRDGPHDAARPPLRRLARERELGLPTRRSRTRSGARSSGRGARASSGAGLIVRPARRVARWV